MALNLSRWVRPNGLDLRSMSWVTNGLERKVDGLDLMSWT